MASESHQDIPECQSLHFLQMACEKLCKAHFYKSSFSENEIQSHAVVAKHLYTILQKQIARDPGLNHDVRSWFNQKTIGKWAKEIDLLCPAVSDNGKRKDNCEYPWKSDGKVHIPAEHDFTGLNFLEKGFGRIFLKLIKQAIYEYAE